jgi:hypothetical protein
VIGLLIVVVAGGLIAATAYATRRDRERAIEETFRRLGAEPRRVSNALSALSGSWAIEGRLRGLTIRYGLHAAGKQRPKQTICEARLVEPTALEMELRPETAREIRQVEHGRAIDLVLGDEAFDDSFIVEAAPSDLARALLDRNARTGLLSFHPCVVTLSGTDLRFAKTGYLDEPAEIARVLELCADLGSRLGALPAQLLEQRLAENRDGEAAGYRGPSPSAMRALEQSPRDASELAALHEARAVRRRVTLMRNLVIVAIAVAAGVLAATMRR